MKEKNVFIDKAGSDEYKNWNSRGKHNIEQKDIAQKNANVKSMKKDGVEKAKNDNILEIVRDIEYNNLDRLDDDRMSGDGSSEGSYKNKPSEVKGDDDEYVEIEMKHCSTCNKSFAPPTFQKLCATLDKTGNPKCVKMYKSKRKVFSSARVRIEKNVHLNAADQRLCVDGRKKVVAELRAISKGKMTRKKSKSWQEQSLSFREAIRSSREFK